MIKLIDIYDVHVHDRARPGAVSFLYELLKERPAAANISHKEMPTLGQHEMFVNSRPYRFWYLVGVAPETEAPVWVGSISATVHNEIGIFIAKTHQRKGYARAAIEQFRLRHAPLPGIPSERNPRWIANVAPGNEASLALFESLGRQISTTFEL